MSKSQHGNREAKKPKQPPKPAAPEGVAPLPQSAPARGQKR
jgi:hypothetical protein